MRDTKQSKEYFDKQIKSAISFASRRDYVELYERACAREKHGYQRLTPLLLGYTEIPMRVIPLMYSRGDGLEEIKNGAIVPLIDRYKFLCGEMVKQGVKYIFTISDRPKNYIPYIHDGVESGYHSVYSWLCWFICFGADYNFLKHIAPFLAEPGKDRLLDTVLAYYQPDRELAESCMNPGAFGLLEQVIDANEKQRAELVRVYLESWPELIGQLNGLKSIGIASASTSGTKTREDLIRILDRDYQGLWAWEAALVVKFFNIDDHSFKDNEFYPYDLVHFAPPLNI